MRWAWTDTIAHEVDQVLRQNGIDADRHVWECRHPHRGDICRCGDELRADLEELVNNWIDIDY